MRILIIFAYNARRYAYHRQLKRRPRSLRARYHQALNMSDTAGPTKPKKPSRRLKGRAATVNTCSTGPKQIALAKRRAKALDLRAMGYSFQRIGAELKYSTTLAFNDVSKALDSITAEPAQKLLKLELRRCDELQAAIYPKALTGDPAAINSALRVMWHRGMLLGWTRNQGDAQVVINGGPESDRKLNISFHLPTSNGGQRAISFDDLQRMESQPAAIGTNHRHRSNNTPPDSSSPPLRIKPNPNTDITLDPVQPSAWKKPRGGFNWE
jgi:hypothetical protein